MIAWRNRSELDEFIPGWLGCSPNSETGTVERKIKAIVRGMERSICEIEH